MVAPIAPLSSVDTVIRRGDQEENRPTASPAEFNIHTKEVIANDKLDQLLYYNKRQTDLLEQSLLSSPAEIDSKQLHLRLPRVDPPSSLPLSLGIFRP